MSRAAFVGKLKSLTNINLFVLALRLVQFFFAGMEVGLMGYYIKQEIDSGDSASSPYVFLLVAAVFTMLTQFFYCFEIPSNVRFLFLWDWCISAGFLLSFFWMLNYMKPLPCGWGAFNPFGSNHCGQSRAVLVIQIVLCVLWFISGSLGFIDLMQRRKKARALGDV